MSKFKNAAVIRVTFDGGTLTTSTNGNLISGAGYAYVRSGGAIVDTGTFSSTVAVPMVEDATSTGGGLAKVGAGTLSLTAANTFTGATTANGGTLKLANSQALQNSTLSVNAGVVVFDSSVGSHAFTVGALSGTGNLALQNNAGTPSAVALTAGGNNASTVYSGSLSGSGSLRKTGSGTLILGGSVGIAGLDANSGAVEVAQSASIGSLNVASGATVSVAANSDGNRSVLNISALTMAGFTPTLATANNATSVSATLLNAEALSAGALAGAGQTQNAGATTAQAAIEPASPEAVPEPGALGLLLTGAAGLLGFRRQGRRR